MKTKPFDLQKALAGEPVVTRYGMPVKIVDYDVTAHERHQVSFRVEGKVYGISVDGHYYPDSDESALDLFMLTPDTTRSGYTCIYADPHPNGTNRRAGVIYPTEQEAIDASDGSHLAVVPVSWEEEK